MDDHSYGLEAWRSSDSYGLGPMGLEGAARFFLLKEAIASVAIEHRLECECDTCLAADGDKEAFLRVWLKVEHER